MYLREFLTLFVLFFILKLMCLEPPNRFTNVYKNNLWGSAESVSGPGSTLKNAESDMLFLKQTLKTLYAPQTRISISDIPCGDMNWMKILLEDLKTDFDIAYTGYDIVDELIEKNAKTHDQYRFETFNIVDNIPPKTDIIICRDLLNHLKSSDVVKALNNLVKSESTYLFISNNRGFENTELPLDVGGASRHLDIEKPPYNFGTAIEYNGHMGLWKN